MAEKKINANVIPALLLKVDGTSEAVTLPRSSKGFLEAAQKYVGGYIEIVRTKANQTLIVDEEGLLKNKKRNEAASQFYTGGNIVGDALLIAMQKERLP